MKRISSSSAEDQPNEKRQRIQQKEEEEEYDPARGLLLFKLVLEYSYEMLEEEMYIAERKYYKKVNEYNDLINDLYCQYRYMDDLRLLSSVKVITGEKKDLKSEWSVENKRITREWNKFFVVCKVIPQ
jgi:hypothetical protein